MQDIKQAGNAINSYFQERGDPFPGYATKKDKPNPTLLAHVSRMLQTYLDNEAKFQVALDNVPDATDASERSGNAHKMGNNHS